jgi:curli production assembly/transport component CsgE
VSNVTLFAQSNDSSYTYTVKKGDFLVKIATELGNPNFWEEIYAANRDKIENIDIIFPGQIFVIPSSVITSPKFTTGYEAKNDPAQKVLTDKEKQLKEFRDAFNKIIQEQQAVEKATVQKEPPASPKTNGLEFGGLVINETRSKMGDDFFNVFYKYWEAPANSGNFILKVTEQPVPSLGTLVAVQIDNQQVYKSRLQPRYNVIENMAKQAVMISYQTLQQKLQTANDITIY